MPKHLRSCTRGDPSQVDIIALNFGETLDKIYMNEYVAMLPSWVEKTKKRDAEDNRGNANKRQNTGNGSGSGGGATPNLPSHHLRDWEKGMRLQPNERFTRVFRWKNTKGIEAPKTKNGTPMCTRFYGTGVCFGNCSKAHVVLDQEEKNTWRKYITYCRDNYKKWQESLNKDDDKEKNKIAKADKVEVKIENEEKKDGKKG